MQKRVLLFLMLLLAPGIFAGVKNNKPAVDNYIETYKDLAISEMRRTGVPASISLAQGILESGCGTSKLAVEAHNHFGIKCKPEWKGKTISISRNGMKECYRKYENAADSYKDHSDFLAERDRYKFLFKLKKTDYAGWATGLKKAGYAANPKYPQLLINTIKANRLSRFDNTIKS